MNSIFMTPPRQEIFPKEINAGDLGLSVFKLVEING